MRALLQSSTIHAEIYQLLINGKAQTAFQAEEIFLDAHLSGLQKLVLELDDESFSNHEAIKLLMFHGSRRLEDAL